MNDRYSEQRELFDMAYKLGTKARQEYGFVWLETPDPSFAEMFQAIKDLLPSYSRALDIGCGEGRNSFFLADNKLDVLGIDDAPTAIQVASELATLRNRTGVSFREMDALALPPSLGTFDVIVQWSVLNHLFPDQHTFFTSEVARLTKPGSFVLLSEYSTHDTRAPAAPEQLIHEEGCVAYFFDRQEIRDLYSPWFDITFHEEVRYPQVHDPVEVRCLHNMILKRR
jgi:tellurite methyltransferase